VFLKKRARATALLCFLKQEKKEKEKQMMGGGGKDIPLLIGATKGEEKCKYVALCDSREREGKKGGGANCRRKKRRSVLAPIHTHKVVRKGTFFVPSKKRKGNVQKQKSRAFQCFVSNGKMKRRIGSVLPQHKQTGEGIQIWERKESSQIIGEDSTSV